MNSIIEELEERSKHQEILPFEEDLRHQLLNLKYNEKLLIEKKFYSHVWDMGSASVLRLLSQVGMFSLPIYLWKLNNPEEQLNIFNDLLETEYYLLADLIEKSTLDTPIGYMLKSLIEDGFTNLLCDLVNVPETIVPNYMGILRQSYLNTRSLERVRDYHLQALLNVDSSATIQEAIGNQAQWNSENILENNTALLDIVSEICINCNATLQKLIQFVQIPRFNNWKLTCLVMNFLIWSSDAEMKIQIKKFLGELFNRWISEQSDRSFYLMMLIARQMSYSAGDNKSDVYYQWYKFQIGDMNYVLKSKSEFQYAMKTLNTLVPLECDKDFLRIQINTAIPAPPYCKVLVTNFKIDCKTKECSITQLDPDLPTITDDIIVLD